MHKYASSFHIKVEIRFFIWVWLLTLERGRSDADWSFWWGCVWLCNWFRLQKCDREDHSVWNLQQYYKWYSTCPHAPKQGCDRRRLAHTKVYIYAEIAAFAINSIVLSPFIQEVACRNVSNQHKLYWCVHVLQICCLIWLCWISKVSRH